MARFLTIEAHHSFLLIQRRGLFDLLIKMSTVLSAQVTSQSNFSSSWFTEYTSRLTEQAFTPLEISHTLDSRV